MPTDPVGRHVDDTEREHVVGVLGQHVGFGRLTLSEFEVRLDAVYAARTQGEMGAVLVDLPDIAPPAVPGPRSDSATSAEWARWAMVGAICLVVWTATSLAAGRPLAFWPVWVIGPWGIVLSTRTCYAWPRRGCGSSAALPR